MTHAGLIVDYLYSHTVDLACQIADWLELQGCGVDIHSVTRKPQAAHAGWDSKVIASNGVIHKPTALLWFVPPPIDELKRLGGLCRNIVVATSDKTAKVMATAAKHSAAVLCTSESARDWFNQNMPQLSVVYSQPAPARQPLLAPSQDGGFHLLSASPSHTTMTQNLPRLMPKYGGLHIDLLLRGPGQARRHVKTPRRMVCHKNNDFSALPEIIAGKHLLLWQRQHLQDNIGVQSLWMGVPVITNRPVEGIASKAVLVVDDRLLIPTAESLFASRSRLKEMQQATHDGLLVRQQQWGQALRSLF